MTNEERREALNEARAKALQWATYAERNFQREPYGSGNQHRIELAKMWAQVADAMKDGDPVHDGPDGASAFAPPSPVLDTEYGTITR